MAPAGMIVWTVTTEEPTHQQNIRQPEGAPVVVIVPVNVGVPMCLYRGSFGAGFFDVYGGDLLFFLFGKLHCKGKATVVS